MLQALLMISGVDELTKHLQSCGIAASVLSSDSDERPQQGWFKSDLGYVKTEDWVADLVAVRFQGGLSPHPRNWSTGIKLKSLPVVNRKVSPVQYHFIIHYRQLGTAADFAAKLKRPGLLGGGSGGPSWKGGRLASMLNDQRELSQSLIEALDADEKLWVEPDFGNFCIRVVLKSRMVFEFSLLPSPTAKLERGLPSKSLLENIEEVARAVRSLM